MKFLIIGVLCIVFGCIAKSNPNTIRSAMNNKAQATEKDLKRTATCGIVILVCGILLILVGIIALITGH